MTRAAGYSRRSSGHSTCTVSNELLPLHRIVRSARSALSLKNMERMKKFFAKFSSVHPFPTTEQDKVHASASNWIMDLLNDYCRTKSTNPMSTSTVLASIQGLRMMFEEMGHEAIWHINDDQSASGNVLKGNPDISAYISSHKVSLAEADYAATRKRPVTVSQIAHHAERFWFGGS